MNIPPNQAQNNNNNNAPRDQQQQGDLYRADEMDAIVNWVMAQELQRKEQQRLNRRKGTHTH